MHTVPPTLSLQNQSSKQSIIRSLRRMLESQSFSIVATDAKRPWGGFLRVSNRQADRFIREYFDGVDLPESARRGMRSPKLLVVAPGQRLSWQHHDRRSEVWRAVGGEVGVMLSKTNKMPARARVLRSGETIEIPQGMRHRLIGRKDWGVVAEIWVHTDPRNPSDEDDIHRHQDDYNR